MVQTTTVRAITGFALVCGAALAQSTDQGNSYQWELLAEAHSRTSMLAGPAPGAPQVHGMLQFQYVWNTRDQPVPTDPNESTNGFRMRRLKIWAEGEVAEGWGYHVRGSFNRAGGAVVIDNAYMTYRAGDTWQIMMGQFKLPFLREQLVLDSRQLTADRSLVAEVFTQDFSQGIQATYSGDAFRFMGAVSDGFNTDNTDFDNVGSEADVGVTARAEYMGAGERDNFRDFTSWREAPFGWMIGGAAHWQTGGETVGTNDSDMWSVTADASFEGNGWNAFVAAVYRGMDIAGAGDDLEDLGWTAQGGIFLSADWELFARFSQVFPDNDAGGDKTFHEFVAGFNYYVIPESHAAKFTVDLCVYPNATTANRLVSGGNSGIGLLDDSGDPQWALRGQFQLLF